MATSQFGKGTKLQRIFKDGERAATGGSGAGVLYVYTAGGQTDIVAGDVIRFQYSVSGLIDQKLITSVTTPSADQLNWAAGTGGTLESITASDTIEFWSFQDIANVTSITGPSHQTDQIDITSHNDETRFRESLSGGGLLESGEVQISCNYDPALDDATTFNDFNALVAELDGGETNLINQLKWRIKFPPSHTDYVEFDARVMGITFGSPTDGALTLDLTLKIDGDITWPQ